jgi:protein-tyrosine phosphatase
MYKFASADENELIVYGAAKPKYSESEVYHWIEFMKGQGIQRVCCLLEHNQLVPYSDLLATYRREFGKDNVCWAPIPDFKLADLETLVGVILPFLKIAVQQNQKVVVHCGGGIGRTGHVLAAWLVNSRGMSNQDAIKAVKKTGRNPYEAVIAAPLQGQNPWKIIRKLNVLLDNCR